MQIKNSYLELQSLVSNDKTLVQMTNLYFKLQISIPNYNPQISNQIKSQIKSANLKILLQITRPHFKRYLLHK